MFDILRIFKKNKFDIMSESILDTINYAVMHNDVRHVLEKVKANPCSVKISSSATYLGYIRTFVKWLINHQKIAHTLADLDVFMNDYILQKKESNSEEYCNNVAWCLNKFIFGSDCSNKPSCIKSKKKNFSNMHEESKKILTKFEKAQFKDSENEMLTNYLLNNLDNHGDRSAFLLLLLKTGMRFVDVFKMNLGQLRQLAESKSVVVRAKGDKRTLVFTNDDGATAARHIVSLYPEVPDNVQIFAPPNESMDAMEYKNKYNSMYASVLRYAKNVQHDVLGESACQRALHAFRRTFANNVYNKSNKDVALVAKMLNHSDIRHTLRYIANDVDVMKSVAAQQ